MKIEYQKLAGLDIPAHLAAKSHTSVRGSTQGSDLEIGLEDCRVE